MYSVNENKSLTAHAVLWMLLLHPIKTMKAIKPIYQQNEN